jgi:hypothetical protein
MPRNNARVIPDGTFTGVSFLKTDFYVQIYGFGDFTKLNIAPNDGGGELDPHGATGAGNPEGGNVTTTVVDGIDQPLAEWMLYIDNNQFCLRACVNANQTYRQSFIPFPFPNSESCIQRSFYVLARIGRDGLRIRHAWHLQLSGRYLVCFPPLMFPPDADRAYLARRAMPT